jgi:hypothetical protein
MEVLRPEATWKVSINQKHGVAHPRGTSDIRTDGLRVHIIVLVVCFGMRFTERGRREMCKYVCKVPVTWTVFQFSFTTFYFSLTYEVSPRCH